MKTLGVALMVLGIILLGYGAGKVLFMNENKYVLKQYEGVGAHVYKHGTIVKLTADGTPTVVGHFDDDSGKSYPGTLVIEEIK